MYFYVYNGKVYWGRHQILPPHRSCLTWIFRNKPVKLNRLYLSGKYSFITIPTTQPGKYAILLSYPDLNNRGDFQVFQVVEERCYFVDKHGFRECGGTDLHQKARQEFKNMFKNRLNEYKGRYFLPIDKQSKYP